MANADHLNRLRQGVGTWNDWRAKKSLVWLDLTEADLHGADLRGADLDGANLSGASLSGADLHRAKLGGANLNGATLAKADLSGAYVEGANLRWVNLNGADLRGVDLSRADLSRADLRGADLDGADLSGANLSGASLGRAKLIKAILTEADLQRANLIDACLDRANLTGVRLWETQLGGWSIKDVICQRAFWDREGKERIDYGEGEFERIFAEKPRIVLRYPGGMSPIDLLALPLVVERVQAEHPGSVLQVRSVQNDGGGASVTITVEDRENRTTEVFAAEIEKLRTDLSTIQDRLLNEEKLRLSFEAQCQVLVERVIPTLAAAPKQQVNIGQLAAPLAVEGVSMSKGDTYNVSGQAGAVGPGAHAHDNAFQQVQSGIDLPKLADELGRLRAAMKGETIGTREQDKAVGAVADAEEAAVKGDGPAALRYIKGAGTWALGVAEKIGVELVTEALKKAM
jgi:uncharacterized protein YjbI with pentapeptide repeats